MKATAFVSFHFQTPSFLHVSSSSLLMPAFSFVSHCDGVFSYIIIFTQPAAALAPPFRRRRLFRADAQMIARAIFYG